MGWISDQLAKGQSSPLNYGDLGSCLILSPKKPDVHRNHSTLETRIDLHKQ
jgi:hypothetical protein